jgi:hypothetical protein
MAVKTALPWTLQLMDQRVRVTQVSEIAEIPSDLRDRAR